MDHIVWWQFETVIRSSHERLTLTSQSACARVKKLRGQQGSRFYAFFRGRRKLLTNDVHAGTRPSTAGSNTAFPLQIPLLASLTKNPPG